MFINGKRFNPQALSDMDKKHALHPWADMATTRTEDPLVVASAKGIRIKDSDGIEYIDGIGGMWCVQIGYGREEMGEAMASQASLMPYYTPFGAMTNAPAARLCEKLSTFTPGDLNTVSLSTSGSEAVDSALRFVQYYFNCVGKPEKKQIITRMDAYHGSTYLAASVCGKRRDWTYFDYERTFIHHIPSPNPYRRPEGQSIEAFCDEKVADLEHKILELGPQYVGCFIAEPIQASGGVIVPPPGYFKRCLDVCRKYDVLFISDEVVTAFGRLGHMFASEEVFDVVPDIIISAKGLTSGYIPLGATIYSDRLIDAISGDNASRDSFFTNGYTYSGHPVACATALKNIEIFEREGILEHVRNIGPYFMEGMQSLLDLPIVGDVRGSHLMACVECVVSKSSKEPMDADIAVAQRVDIHAQEKGLIVRPMESLCVLSPPLIIEKEDIDRIVDIMRDSIVATQNDLQREGIWSPH